MVGVFFLNWRGNSSGDETGQGASPVSATTSNRSVSVLFARPQVGQTSNAPAEVAEAKHLEVEQGTMPSADSRVDGIKEPPRTGVAFSGPASLATVDFNQLMGAHPPASDSEEARRKAIQEVKQAIAVVARAHQLELVLERSAQTVNRTPFVLVSDGAPDITEEVLLELRRTNRPTTP